MVIVRGMKKGDIDDVASVHSAAFPRQTNSKDWINCNFRAFPRIQYYVAELEGSIIGFVEWLQKSGFRKEVVLELEQMAILPDQQRKGFGKLLIRQSLPLLTQQLAERGATLKHVIVTTRSDNSAQRLYAGTLNAQIEATISNLYSADEVLMIARNVKIEQDNNQIQRTR